MIRRAEWIALAALLAAYLVLAGAYAVRTPDWQAPDEPAHYNYIRQIADEGRLPVLNMGDWQQAYQDELTASGFDPALLDRLDTVQYEDHQPPLYYLLLAPVFALTGGDLLALRLTSALLGAGVVLGAWGALRWAFPARPTLALTGAGFVAFLPQHLSILGSVSNDALAELLVALTLWATVAYLGSGPRRPHPALLGLLVGLALLTKTTIYFLAGIAALAILLRARRERWPLRTLARHAAATLLPALVLGGVWWARNVSAYGGTDFTGLRRHDAVTVGQVRTDDYLEDQFGGDVGAYLEEAATTTFHSFWGQFGWMAVPLPPRVYQLLGLFTVGVLLGAGIFVRRAGWLRALSGPQRDAGLIFAATLVFAAAAFVLYNLDFVQFQGRYLYPALIPLGLLAALGLHGWASLLPLPDSWRAWLPVLAMFALALFAYYALDAYLVPSLPTW